MSLKLKLKNYFFYFLIIFFSSEGYLRFIKSGFNVQPINPSSFVHHEHPTNFQFRAYHPLNEWGDFLVSFDEFGNREMRKLCKNGTQFNSSIIFLGDSFTEAIQVSDNNSFTGLIQKELCINKIKISNLGVTSYSPVLSYIQLKSQLKRNKKINFKGSTIIHMLSENDAEDDKKYYKQIKFVLDNENLSEIPYIDSKKRISLLKSLSRGFYNIRLLRRIVLTIKVKVFHKREKTASEDTERIFSSTDKCYLENKELKITSEFINKISSLAKTNGARYVLSAIPDDPKNKEISNYSCYKKVALKSNIEFVDAPEELFKNPSKYYFKKDLHLNILGNKLLANKIIKFIYKKNIHNLKNKAFLSES